MSKPRDAGPDLVTMPALMKAAAQGRWASYQAAQLAFSSYVEGCMQGLGLEGDWNLDTGRWAFVKRPKPPEPEKI